MAAASSTTAARCARPDRVPCAVRRQGTKLMVLRNLHPVSGAPAIHENARWWKLLRDGLTELLSQAAAKVPMPASKCLGKLICTAKARIDFRQRGVACLADPVEKRSKVLLTVVACGFEPRAALRQGREAENTRRGDQGMRFAGDP